jgi:putative transposase
MSEWIDRKLGLDALRMALVPRRPQQGLIHHSHRGSEYASGDYQQLFAKHELRGIMSRLGDCWDNAVAESFFASLKLELVYQAQWRIRAAAIAIFEYFELFYNRRRRHSSLGYLSPVDFERRNGLRLAA